jgi:hypothetical protein
LDDSLSMDDRAGSGTAFDRGRRAISQLTAAASGTDQRQLITLIRCSRAARRAGLPDPPAAVADLNAVPITSVLETLLEQQGSTLVGSQLAVDPLPALELVARLIREARDEHCVLHVVSDFRRGDWSQAAETRETLQRIAKQGTDINLIRCAESQAPNLAIESLGPEVGTLAAGVPLFMKVAIKNYGSGPAERVRLRTGSVFYPQSPAGAESAPQETELPDVLLDRIEAGETATRTFQVFFATSGHHVVNVELPSDALVADNRRWCVVELEAGESALIVDGDPSERSAYYLESIFRPGTKAKTGIVPSVQPVSYLRDASPEELARHRAIYLLDVPPLEARTLENLRAYVEAGGGLTCFLGPSFNAAFYSNWYNGGVFPLPLGLRQTNAAPIDSPSADVQFEEHPMFRALAGQRNPFAAAIRIREYVAVQERWQPPVDSGIEVLARLPDGQPLVVERRVGAGRVVAFLTTLAPDWNNWSLEPSFIVMALQLHAYLAQPQRPRADRLVGDALTVQLDPTVYRPELTFVAPTAEPQVNRELAKVASAADTQSSSLLTALLGESGEGTAAGETDFSGIYDVQMQTLEGQPRHRRYALNVDTRESTLAVLDSVDLRRALEPLSVHVYQADQPVAAAGDSPRNAWSELLLWVLLAMLLVEQWLAYRLSYHPYAMQTTGGVA